MDAAILKQIGLGGAYYDYGEGGPDLYLTKTRTWAARFKGGGEPGRKELRL
jgi:hypothetical protein